MKRLTVNILMALMLICLTFMGACDGCIGVDELSFTDSSVTCEHLEITEKVLVSPSCTTEGTLKRTCSSCGLSAEVVMPELWHNFVDGVCVRCKLEMDTLFIESFDLHGDGSVMCSVYKNGMNGEVKLVFTGAGVIPNYSEDNLPPWHEYIGKVNLVVIEEGITAIGSNAFSGCTEIKEVILPYSLTMIGNNAFRNCSSLSSLNLSNLSSIGSFAFSGCGSLGSILLGDLFAEMGEGAFENSGVTDVTIKGNAEIGDGAFKGCGFLTAIDFPYIEFIRTDLFGDCTSLQNVNLSNNLKGIGSGAFANTGIQNIVIPDSVTEIGDNAFNGCGKLTEVYIPSGVQSVGNGAFGDCGAVENVYFSGSYAEFEELFANSGISSSNGSFEVTEIPATPNLSYFAFDLKEDGTYEVYASGNADCPENLVLPIFYDGIKVTSVKENGFANLAITTVLIPDNYLEIKAGAFENSGLAKVYWLGSDADYANITVGENNGALENATLYLYRTEYPFVSEEGNFWHLIKSAAVEWSEESLYVTKIWVECDTVNGNIPASEASVQLERVNYYKGNFNLTLDENGEVATNLPLGDYHFIIKASGCQTTTGYFTIYDNDYNEVSIIVLPAEEQQLTNGIKGKVTELQSGSALAGITVLVRAGKNVTSGAPLVRLTTDYSGNFTTDNLENGDYTVHFFNETGINSEKLTEKFVNVTVNNGVVNLAVSMEAPFVDYSFSDSFVYNGHTYYLFLNKLSWSEAKAFCEAKGGYLAKIDSAEENATLVSEFKPTVQNYSYEYFYFGANDKEVNGQWHYTDGSSLPYTNWLNGQPDNASHGGTNEYCATISLLGGGWNDMKDDGKTRNDGWEPNGFIMEVDEVREVGTSYAKGLRYNGHDYYLFLTSGITWEAAATLCKESGGYLVSITTASEQSAIFEAFKEYYDGFTTDTWIGLTDRESEGSWKWESGEPYNYKNWEGSQPDDYQGVEEYVHLQFDKSGVWNDTRATTVFPAFIMEIGAPNIESSAPLAKPITKAYFNGHTYVLYTNGSTWDQANEYCINLGGHLATITSPAENSVVSSLLSAGGANALIGLRKDDSDVWHWVTGETYNYTSWSEGEPNNQGNEYVGEIYPDGKWNDINGGNGSAERYFVLEYDSIIMPEYDRLFTYNGHTYMLVMDEIAWTSAKSLAQSLGGHLITYNTRNEELAVEQALNGLGNAYIFMGATDCEKEKEWHWVTAEGFNYVNWAKTQPDNAGSNEHYGHIYFIDNQIQGWNDVPNTGNFQYQLGYIIEFDYLWVK